MRTLSGVRNGTKLIVTSRFRDHRLTPGSMFRFIRVRSLDKEFPALSKCDVLFLRKGKTGVPRIEQLHVYIPLVKGDEPHFEDLLPIGRGWLADVEIAEDDIANDNFDLLSWMMAKALTLNNFRQHPAEGEPLGDNHPLMLYNTLREQFNFDRDSAMALAGSKRSEWVSAIRRADARTFRQEVTERMDLIDKEFSVLRGLELVNAKHFSVISKALYEKVHAEIVDSGRKWRGVAERLMVPVPTQLKIFF